MNTRKSLHLMPAIALAAGLSMLAAQAQAHAHLVTSTPSAKADVAAPKQIALTFSEKLEPKFSAADLMKADGSMVAVTSAVSGKAKKGVMVMPKAPLTPGSYMVMWHVVSADGHKSKGDYNFTVH